MFGFNRFRSSFLMAGIASALMAMARQVVDTVHDLVCKVAAAVLEPVSMARTEAELAQAAVSKPKNNGKAVIGSGSGYSPVSFVSMLKDLNSRGFAAVC